VCGTQLGIATEGNRRPNILLIITDQQHAGMLSCAGNPYLRTPALDSLAASGMRFERAYASNPVCAPARMSMFTGLMPSTLGMRSNAEVSQTVPPEVLKNTMGWIFRRAGYRTVYGGKTHWMRGMTPSSAGFEDLTRDSREELAQRAAEFLRSPGEQPFLLVCSFINPHDICYMAIDAFTEATGREKLYPQAKRDRECLAEALRLPQGVSEEEFFRRLCPPLPPNFEIPEGEPDGVSLSCAPPKTFRGWVREHWAEREWRLHRWAYCRLTEKVDAEIGIVLAALRETGLEKNTLVIFTSDHGDMDGAHRLEHKSVPYEESARVPLIVSWPGHTKAGWVDREHLVSVGLDLIPTLCDFAGIEKPNHLLGRSVRPIAEGKTVSSWRSCLAVEGTAWRMIRTARYKYVVYEEGQRREQLIDLEKDPGEMKNLASDPQYRGVLMEHRRLLWEWASQINDSIGQAYLLLPE
jgi:choline-sulfatase